MNDIKIVNNWYAELINDLKKLTFEGIVKTKHSIGKRIIEDELKFGKPEYGSKRIENLAKDLQIGRTELYCCIQFAKQYELSDISDNLTWYEIEHKLLPELKKEKEILPLPEGKYNIIYADPPWQYYEGGYKNQSQHYNTMTFEEIKNLAVKDITANDCILFLWATSPILNNAFNIIETWGFEYSTVGFVWIKSKNDGTGFAFGCGNWTRANAEYCLIGTKGNIERKNASISQIIYLPKEEHSKKPDITRDKIIQLVGDLPRIELFARQKIEGWNIWGDEI